nr:pitrilysin family protein [Alteromonas sp. a30]
MTQITSHQSRSNNIGIDYQKFKLDNGLTILLHEDHSDPLVHVDVTYHVGSAREEVGKSGFAHFFEHMMFQGSEHVADEQHFELITEAGGTLNGSTNSDRTNYYQTVPANHLEKVLWLEADRMGFLLPAVTKEKFEIQRETVKNERAQRVDSQPYGRLDEKVAEALFPEGHPYSWQPIGYVEDLDRVTVDDLKAFFQRWYGPNNAIISIGGDIDVEQTLTWVKKYFGNIPKGPDVNNQPKSLVTLPETRYITLEDDVHLPLVQIVYPTVYVRHEDEAALDVLSDILGNGKTSIIYQNLVQKGEAVQASVSHPCQELACQFKITALPNPQSSLSLQALENKLRATLDVFERQGVSDDDIARTKMDMRASTIFGLQSVAGKVSTLAFDEYMSGEPDLVESDLLRYDAVTKADVMRVFKRYIKGKPSVVVSVVPKGQTELVASAQNFEFTRDIKSVESQTYIAKVPPEDDFDRSQIPPPQKAPIVNVPTFWQTKFNNGMEVWGHKTDETPTTLLRISLEGGPLLDPKDKAGLASLTASMMSASTQQKTEVEIANQLSLLGSRIQFSASGRNTVIEVSSLTENLDETLALLKERLFQPAFLASEFALKKQRISQSLQQRAKRPNALMAQASLQLLYGEDNRMGIDDSGNSETFNRITLEDVKAFYQQYYSPNLSSLISVTDLDQQALLSKLSFLKSWQAKPYQIPPYEAFPEFSADKLFVVDKPDANQSIIRLLKPFLPFDALGEQFRSTLMNFPLGGAFNSRINLNLREDKGYTYGANSLFIGGKTLGLFRAGGAINHVNTVKALEELIKEIKRYQQKGMTEKELSFLREAYISSDALSYETPSSKAAFLQRLYHYGLSPDFVEKQNQLIENIELDELNELARRHLDLNSMHIVIVGDLNALAPELIVLASELNREIQLLDVNL